MYQLIVLLVAVFGMASANYCNMASCEGRPHIGCNHSGYWSNNCPADAVLVSLSNADKNVILDTHNKLRNKIASGLEPTLPSASRMATMTWDQELADLCTLNVMQCDMKLDQCINTARFNLAGQTVALITRSDYFQSTHNVIYSFIDLLYDDIKDASTSAINKCCQSESGKEILGFTQSVTEAAFKVGCSIARYTDGLQKLASICCNYSRGNQIGTPVYSIGAKASGCKTGSNPAYPGLCSVNEVYNPNQ